MAPHFRSPVPGHWLLSRIFHKTHRIWCGEKTTLSGSVVIARKLCHDKGNSYYIFKIYLKYTNLLQFVVLFTPGPGPTSHCTGDNVRIYLDHHGTCIYTTLHRIQSLSSPNYTIEIAPHRTSTLDKALHLFIERRGQDSYSIIVVHPNDVNILLN